MQSWVGKTIIICSIPAFLAGCGSSSSSRKPGNTVAQVVLTSGAQTSLSLVPGEVETLSFQAQNSSGAPVSNPNPTVTYTSSDPNLVTVFGTLIAGVPTAEVCAGVWDSAFIVCKPGTDSAGNPLLGKATIIATSEGVSSAPVPVAIHQVVTSVTVDPAPGCFSTKQTHQFVAHALHNGTDITNQIGNFAWTSSEANVVSIDANGIATAANPGLTGVVATVGTVASPAVNFKTCMPVRIILHINGDPAGMPTESVTQSVTSPLTTTTIQADMIDENNVTTASAPVTVLSNNIPVGSLAGVTLTAEDAGGAGLVAVCAPPNCGAGLTQNTPVYSNLFSLNVTGASAATTVYATTTFAPPTASPTPTILPIDTSKTPPAAGTAINMPCPTSCAVPNSLVFAANGSKAFMGTSLGLASLDPTANTVTILDPFVGKVLAVSPDGSTVIESNAASAPDPITGVVRPIESRGDFQRVVVFTTSAQTFTVQGANAAAFTTDGSKAFISTNNGSGNVYVFSTFATFRTVTIPGSSADVTTLASGPFTFLANGGLQVMGTCNNAQQPAASNPPTQSTSIQLVQAFKNADAFVAMDSTGVNIETATVTALAPPTIISPTNCVPNVAYSNQFVDFGLGPITATQLLVPSALSSHIVVLPANSAQVLVAIAGNSGPGIIPLASGATAALSGGLTQDGDTLWVGVAGTNKVDEINLLTSSDVLQISTSFQKSDGTAAPPNLVAVKPK